MKRADQRKHHYIYKITRTDGSGKFYIGMHSTDNLDDGYFGGGTLLWKSINKHGKDRHVKEILEHLPTREALKLREREIVNGDLLGDVLCMNLQLGGGEGGFISKEHQQKCAAAGGKKSWMQSLHLMHTSKSRAKALETKRRSGIDIVSAQMREASNSIEAIQKRKATYEARQHQVGSSNSQFGTCWVCKDSQPLKIQKHELESYLLKGFSRGRK